MSRFRKLRLYILASTLVGICVYSISHHIFVALAVHFYRGYVGKHVFYHWYLFHSDMLDMLWTLLPIVALLVGVITPENIMVKIVLMFLVGAIIFWDMILGAGASSDGILRMHHRGSTRYEGHIYYLADFEMPDWWGGWHRDSARVLYQCDSLGLICSSEFSITDDDRKEILDRIQ